MRGPLFAFLIVMQLLVALCFVLWIVVTAWSVVSSRTSLPELMEGQTTVPQSIRRSVGSWMTLKFLNR